MTIDVKKLINEAGDPRNCLDAKSRYFKSMFTCRSCCTERTNWEICDKHKEMKRELGLE